MPCRLLLVSGLLGLSLASCENAKPDPRSGELPKEKASAATQDASEDQPLNESLTAAAWDAYKRGKYEEAISNAEKCIEEFRGSALLRQDQLEKEKAVLPTGEVSAEMKKKIFANGLLNDVGTCYYIKGISAQKLGNKAEAMKAFQEAKRFTYARAWDPRQWFWSPAAGAAKRSR
jgi:tetratricopeptide (TPR) repeat protein